MSITQMPVFTCGKQVLKQRFQNQFYVFLSPPPPPYPKNSFGSFWFTKETAMDLINNLHPSLEPKLITLSKTPSTFKSELLALYFIVLIPKCYNKLTIHIYSWDRFTITYFIRCFTLGIRQPLLPKLKYDWEKIDYSSQRF